MGCGCGGGKRSVSRSAGFRPTSGPTPASNTPTTNATPAQLKALGLSPNIDPLTQQRLDSDRLRIEKLRREAVRKALNR